jgi:hypothetical protein
MRSIRAWDKREFNNAIAVLPAMVAPQFNASTGGSDE